MAPARWQSWRPRASRTRACGDGRSGSWRRRRWPAARQDPPAWRRTSGARGSGQGRRVDVRAGRPRGHALNGARQMAKTVGIAASPVVRIWHDHGLAPHRWRGFKLSNDKLFAEKLHGVVGRYVDPPAHAIVLSFDEKS